MARNVDIEGHERQKADIARALWRIAARAGLESVSMREVAAEAGVSIGRVQYYFRNKEAMLLFGLQMAQKRMESRIEDRLQWLPDSVGAEEILRAAIEEVIGGDSDTNQAIRVSVAYLPRTAGNPAVADILFDGDAELHALAAEVVRCAQADRAPQDLDPDLESRIIWSLANSLGIEVAFGQTTVQDARATMDYYLDRTLGRRPAAGRP